MKHLLKTNRIYVAIAAILSLLLVFQAKGQYRVGSDGQALDANNQIGSGGYNTGPLYTLPQATGNQIVTGNVTGGQSFRGNIGYTDPSAFRGQTAGVTSDRFIRDTSGIPGRGVPADNYGRPMPYYGYSQTVAPPPNYMPLPNGGGYVPAPIQQSPTDVRLGLVNNRIIENRNLLASPGEYLMPGQVNPSPVPPMMPAGAAEGQAVGALPPVGMRDWNSNDQEPGSMFNYSNPVYGLGAIPTGVNEKTINQMRQELNNTPIPENSSPNQQTGRPAETPMNPNLAAPTQPKAMSGGAMETAPSVDQGVRQKLIAPGQQSTQYAELQKRLEKLRGTGKLTDEEANRIFREQVRLRDAAAKAKQQGTSSVIKPALPEEPETTAPNLAEQSRKILAGEEGAGVKGQGSAEKTEPLHISSLAEGVKAPGLGNVLKRAEELMKDGKYISALDQYDLAERVAPNNPLIWMGRANAELAASYYARAEAHLRQAFAADPALLMAKFDLNQFFGAQRVQAILSELKQIAQENPTEARPMFLLAYLAYNTGQDARASDWLALAQKRAGNNDQFLNNLAKYWVLPGPATKPAE